MEFLYAHPAIRRSLTVSAVLIGWCACLGALPALALAAALVDLVRSVRRRRASVHTARLLLFAIAFLSIEVSGLIALALVGLTTPGRAARRAQLTWVVQRQYVGGLFWAAARLLDLRVRTEGDEALAATGPLIVFMRHASIVDTLLPGVLLSRPHGLRLRYVLKRELELGPCLDIAGHWLPNCFVRRDRQDSATEIARVRNLKHGLGPSDGVLLYPEGTRLTPERKARALEALSNQPDLKARAAALVHLMPPRLGGVLALLEAPPACDVLFVGHAGLDGFSHLSSVWAGELQGREIRVRYWRVAAAAIPEDSRARIDWLYDRWAELDAWLTLARTSSA